MMRQSLSTSVVLFASASLFFACGEEGDDTNQLGSGAGGSAAPGVGGANSSGGALASGGQSPESSGGATNPAGGAGSETGGATSAGTGGASSSTVAKSPGCTMPPTAAGSRTISVNGQSGDYILSIPSDYSKDSAYPLGFAFHGFGRTGAQCQAGDCKGFQSVMKEEALLVYMKSFSDGWEQTAIREQNVDFFEAVLEEIESEFCVDENKIFVAGTSSGAHFSNVLGCRFGDKLQAIAPVAGYLPESDNCVGQVAVVAVHGIDDPHVTFDAGETARDFFRAQNGCSTTSVPDLSGVHAEIRASRDKKETQLKCVDYEDCDSSFPVRWCEHSEGGYDDSTHGWPSAGGQTVWDFVSSL